jgi:hypothetical protein
MKNIEQLKEIVLLYANTEPEPMENLRRIEAGLLAECYRDPAVDMQIWEPSISRDILSIKIETTIRLNNLGLEGAATIKEDPHAIDEFMTEIIGYADSYPPKIEQRQEWFLEALVELYGHTLRSCPCSQLRKEILQKQGYLSTTGDEWIKERPTCLQCDHMYFTAILEDLSAGSFKLLGESGIPQQYNKTTVETVDFTGDPKRPLRKSVEYSFTRNVAAFPDYLNGLPGGVLIDLLTTQGAQQIKKCPLCGQFFFAKDSKRTVCYNPACIRKREATKKQAQRDRDPVKYI